MSRLLIILLLGAANAATLSVSPGATSASPGTSLILNVHIAGVADLYAFQFDLAFDPSVLSAGSVSEGSFLSGGGNFFPGFIDNVGGAVTFVANSLNGPGPGSTGAGPLASILFDVLGTGTSVVSVANAILLDSALNDIPATGINGGTVTVAGGAIPEAATFGCVGLALAGIGLMRRYRNRHAAE